MPRLGLGCSRFGSLIDGVDRPGATRLLAAALDLGIRDFDTANIYGQGDSEKLLGALLPKGGGVRITTKAGQVFSPAKRLMIPLKPLLRPIVARRAGMRASVSVARGADMARDWSPAHLTRSLERSLRRLRRDQVDRFLLHSPSAEVLRDGAAIDTLVKLREAGKAIAIGASVDDAAAFAAAVADPRVEVIQFPLSPALPMGRDLIDQAINRGVELVSREILGGARGGDAVGEALAFAGRQPVTVALLGTRSPKHLRQAVEAVVGTPC